MSVGVDRSIIGDKLIDNRDEFVAVAVGDDRCLKRWGGVNIVFSNCDTHRFNKVEFDVIFFRKVVAFNIQRDGAESAAE